MVNRSYLVKPGHLLHTRRVFVLGSPASKEFRAFLSHLGIRQSRSAAETEALKQRFICEGSLKARSGILNEAIEDG